MSGLLIVAMFTVTGAAQALLQSTAMESGARIAANELLPMLRRFMFVSVVEIID
jgi:hypothetical protein